MSRHVRNLACIFLAAIGVCVLRLLIDHPPGGSLGLAWPDATWIEFRRTAVLAAAIVGASLALAGVLLQTMLRNPLASPFILGVSSGAGLGLMVATWISFITVGAAATIPGSGTVPALLGALGALALVYALGQRRGWPDPVALVLVGVVVSTIAAGGMMFFQHLVPTGLRGAFTTWLMGSIPEVMSGWRLLLAGGLACVGTAACLRLAGALDASLLGDDEARSIGVALGPLRLQVLCIAGLLTAVSVAIAGPIAFIGLVAPHMARLLVGGRHIMLVPGSIGCGVLLLVGADVLRQGIDLGGGRMPVGVLTTIGGGIVFLLLLRMELRRS